MSSTVCEESALDLAIREQRRDTLKRFPISTPVEVAPKHAQPARAFFGIVEGYVYNSCGECCVLVKEIVRMGEPSPRRTYHPEFLLRVM